MENQSPNGQILLSWPTYAHDHYIRGMAWYVIFGILWTAFVVYSVWTFNFTLAAILVMFAAVVAIQATRAPHHFEAVLTDRGILIGDRFVPYRDLVDFWIIYDPPICSLYLDLKTALVTRLHIGLESVDPNKVREILRNNVKEDLTHDSEPVIDSVSRILKI
jgi:hypothetical protein